MHKVCILLAAMVGVGSATTVAEEWRAGAIVAGAASGEVVIEEIGGTVAAADSMEAPAYFSGQIRVRTGDRSEVFIRASNQVALLNRGTGFFAIERFEQTGGVSDAEKVEASRMILNLRRGTLVVDNRAVGDRAQLTLETPVGRVSVDRALWFMHIDYDDRKRMYSFTIACADGGLRFTDRGGAQYSVRAGQRLSGVGIVGAPSIDVADLSGEARELFVQFSEYAAAFAEADFDRALLVNKLGPPVTVSSVTEEDPSAPHQTVGGRRPLIIEHAPRSAPVTPFRGIVRPLSPQERGLF